MGAVFIGIILLCRVGQHVGDKKISNNIQGMTTYIHYGAYRQLLSAGFALLVILFTGDALKIDLLTFLISGFSGLMLVVSMFCGMLALKSGTIALTSMFGAAGILVPSIAGVFLFDTAISTLQWVGVGLFFVASYLLMASSKNIYSNFSFKTVLVLLASMLSNGLTMFAQQLFTHYVPKGNVSIFSFLTFGILGIALLLYLPVQVKVSQEKIKPLSKPLLLYGVLLSFCVFVINQLATLATTLVPPVILFTFINGGSTIIAVVVGAVLFKEKLTSKSLVGVIIGVVALIVIESF